MAQAGGEFTETSTQDRNIMGLGVRTVLERLDLRVYRAQPGGDASGRDGSKCASFYAFPLRLSPGRRE